jgi:uncharacterized protein YjlB
VVRKPGRRSKVISKKEIVMNATSLNQYDQYLHKDRLARYVGQSRKWDWKKFWFKTLFEFRYHDHEVIRLTKDQVVRDVKKASEVK